MKIKVYFFGILAFVSSIVTNAQIQNSSVLDPRPKLTRSEILQGKLVDFNCLNQSSNTASKPTGWVQRMIASSDWYKDYNNVWYNQDSVRYIYSSDRGSTPKKQVGNVTTLDNYDSSYRVLGTPYYSYTAYLYDNNNRAVQFKGYDTNALVTNEVWYEYFTNDTISNKKTISHSSADTNHLIYEEVSYNSNGMRLRDSIIIGDINSGLGEYQYGVKHTYFDNSGRISSTDSLYKTIDSLGLYYYGGGTVTNNYYNSSSSVFPDNDSVFYYDGFLPNGSVDTFAISIDYYHYDGSNNLTEWIPVHEIIYGSGLPNVLDTLFKNVYTYNSSNQLLTYIQQPYDNGQFSNSYEEEVYQYTQGINTSYISYNYDGNGNFIEDLKSLSFLTDDFIIDSVATYEFGIINTADAYLHNSFKNVDTFHEVYFSNGYGSPTLESYSYYYYQDYNDPTAITNMNADATNLLIYPNPAENVLQYKFNNSFLSQKLIVSIYDLLGRVVYCGNLSKSAGSINLANLKPASYYLQITDVDSKTLFKKKFIKI